VRQTLKERRPGSIDIELSQEQFDRLRVGNREFNERDDERTCWGGREDQVHETVQTDGVWRQRRPWFSRGASESEGTCEGYAPVQKRMKELEAEDACKRGGLLARVMRFFSSKHGTR
jgi:hypothetical protein